MASSTRTTTTIFSLPVISKRRRSRLPSRCDLGNFISLFESLVSDFSRYYRRKKSARRGQNNRRKRATMPLLQTSLPSLYGHRSDAIISGSRHRQHLQNCSSILPLTYLLTLAYGFYRREKRHLALIELGYVQDMDGANKLAEKL